MEPIGGAEAAIRTRTSTIEEEAVALTTGFALPKFNWRRGKHAWDRHTWLYVSVLIAVVLGAAVGLIWPEVGRGFEGAGHRLRRPDQDDDRPDHLLHDRRGRRFHRQSGTVGKIGGLALLYFMVMSTFALAIGLVVGNIIHPGAGLDMASSTYDVVEAEAKTTQEFILGIIPTTFFSAFTGESVAAGAVHRTARRFRAAGTRRARRPIMEAVKQLQKLVFRILGMILWLAPIGAFGAIAAVVGKTGVVRRSGVSGR